MTNITQDDFDACIRVLHQLSLCESELYRQELAGSKNQQSLDRMLKDKEEADHVACRLHYRGIGFLFMTDPEAYRIRNSNLHWYDEGKPLPGPDPEC